MPFLEEYTLLEQLGQGAFASVYKVRHNRFGYIRAIRVLNTLIANGEFDDTYRKFVEECKVLLRIGNGNTPHIVHLYQPKLLDHKALVEMDYIQGLDIAHFLKKNDGFVEAYEIIRLALDISSALAYCHVDIYKYCMDREIDNLPDDPNDGSKVLVDHTTRQRLINKYRVIHNDIHSGNIMRREDGSYVLLDFGLALSGDEVARKSQLDNGAPEFKAPEKWDGNNSALSTSSDIYSFGIVLYELLAGRVPFVCDKKNKNSIESIHNVARAHKSELPPDIFTLRNEAYARTHQGQRLTERDYPEWLESMILKCLAKNPSDRYRDGKELFDFIQRKAGEAAIRKEINVLRSENLRLSRQEPKIIREEVRDNTPELNSKIRQLENERNRALNERDAALSEKEKTDARVSRLEQEIEQLKKKTAGASGHDTVYNPDPASVRQKSKNRSDSKKDISGSYFNKLDDDNTKRNRKSKTSNEWLLPILAGLGAAILIFIILQWIK